MQKAENMKSKRLVDTESSNAECGVRSAESKEMSPKEAAEILGVSERTIQRWVEAGKLKGQFVNRGKGYGKGGQVLKVWIEDETQNAKEKEGDNPDSTPSTNSGRKSGTVPNRYKVHRGEPGCSIVTPLINGEPVPDPGSPIINIEASKNNGTAPILCLRQTQAVNGDSPLNKDAITPPSPPAPCEVIIPPSQGPFSPATPQLNLPMAITGNSPPRPIPASCQKTANLRFALIQAVKEKLSENSRSKAEIIKSFLEVYSAGISMPAIYNDIGPVKRATLYEWIRAEKDHGIEGLIPQYGRAAASAILPGEKDFLLKFLLDQNKPKISDGIRECKRYLGEYSVTGRSTLRRFVNEFKKQYHDVWTLRREGEKAWNDKDAPYQDRDPMLLEVGEVVVADGHKLNLNVIDPITGKKKRAVLVLFWDWKSTYPLGWEIMFSENIQCIGTALRNALLTLGKIPSYIYIDNGKAFLAKIFTRKIQIEETEIPGMIARLGSQYRRAMPYHGQSKPIERFFRIINDRMERRMKSYVGASIEDKPPYLLRNEKLAQQLHDDRIPTIEDVFTVMLQWREEYIDEPLPKRQGLTARQMFGEGKGAGLDPKALCFLMMAVEVKSVRRSRFTFAGIDWEGPCLYGYHGKVIIRYSLSDFSKIFVFDINDQRLMGVVTQCGKVNPIKDWQAAKRIVAERRKDKRDSKKLAAFIQEKRFLIEGRRDPDLIDYIEAEEAKKPENRILLPHFDDESEILDAVARSETDEPRFNDAWERYEFLLKKLEITDEEKSWINDYEKGAIFPGEWTSNYGTKAEVL